jgi:hypothetical protein
MIEFLRSGQIDVLQVPYVRVKFHNRSTKVTVFKHHSAGVAKYADRLDVSVLQVRDFVTGPITLFMSMKILVLVNTYTVSMILCGCKAGYR